MSAEARVTRTVRMRDGIRVRTARWRAHQARDHVVLLQGRGDFLEKHDDLAGRLTALGCDVVSLDWRGQGGSDRLGARTTYADAVDLADHHADLVEALAAWSEAGLPGRRLLVGHSMGALLGLRHLREHPAGTDAAVLLSPMLAFPGVPGGAALLLTRAACALGLGTRLAAGEQAWRPGAAAMMSTTDADGRAWLTDLERTHPDLVVGGSTWRWARAALEEMARARAASYAEVRADVLLALAGADMTVDNRAALQVAARLPRSQVVTYPRQGHDLLLAGPGVRERVHADLVAHLGLVHAGTR